MSRNAALRVVLMVLAAGASWAPARAGAQVQRPVRVQEQVQEQGQENEPSLVHPPSAEAWQGTLGVRSMFIRSAGFDPFSGNDVLTQVSLGFERVLMRRDAFAFAAGIGTDFGGSDSTARAAPSDIRVWRFTLVAEGRYQPWRRAYGFVRFAPGMLHASVEVEDTSTPNRERLDDSFDVLAVDTSAGAAVRLSGPANPVAAWITAEGGYGWAGSHHLLLAPEAAPRDQAKLAPLDLGTIDPRGAFLRLAVAITY